MSSCPSSNAFRCLAVTKKTFFCKNNPRSTLKSSSQETQRWNRSFRKCCQTGCWSAAMQLTELWLAQRNCTQDGKCCSNLWMPMFAFCVSLFVCFFAVLLFSCKNKKTFFANFCWIFGSQSSAVSSFNLSCPSCLTTQEMVFNENLNNFQWWVVRTFVLGNALKRKEPPYFVFVLFCLFVFCCF